MALAVMVWMKNAVFEGLVPDWCAFWVSWNLWEVGLSGWKWVTGSGVGHWERGGLQLIAQPLLPIPSALYTGEIFLDRHPAPGPTRGTAKSRSCLSQ